MVFRLLVRAGPEGVPVGRIQKSLDIPGSTLSHHIQRLVGAGLAHQEREGAELICSADFGAMRAIIDYLEDECCADAAEESKSTN